MKRLQSIFRVFRLSLPRRICAYMLSHYGPPVIKIPIMGQTMYFPREEAADALRMAAGIYEKQVVYLVKRLVKEGDIVVDCGASYGYYTILFASLVGRGGKVFAFEPDPISYALLLRNIQERKSGTVIAVNKVVADRKGGAMLLVPKTGRRAGSTLMFDAEKGFLVDVTTLDEYLKDNDRAISLVKMDIEGMEMAALQGMRNILLSSPNLKIITEFYPQALKEKGYRPKEYLDMLRAYGFSLYHIDEERGTIHCINDLAKFVRNVENTGTYVNVLCLRGDQEF